VTSTLTVRPARPADAADLAALLNAIIAIGGTTALETPYSADAFARYFIDGPNSLSCFVAEDAGGALAGFQALGRIAELPAGWGDIGTFARVAPKVAGVGRALFPATRQWARDAGLQALNATIRADNTGGLAYYAAVGFETYKVVPAVPLSDGTPVDRIWKRFDLAAG